MVADMNASTTREERDELRSVTRSFLQREVPSVDLRAHSADGFSYDHAAWSSIADTLGLQGLIVPDEFGGLGLGIRELAVVCEELGRSLYNGPFISSAVIASALLREGDGAPRALLHDLAAGVTIAAVASPLRPSSDRDAGYRVTTADDGRSVVSGEELFVMGAIDADLLLVPAMSEQGLQIFGVDPRADGVRVVALDSLDLLRPMATVVLDQVHGELLINETTSRDAMARAIVIGQIALAAESIGGAARALEMTIEYVGQRVQFGRIIGAFQAVKHRCADMLVELEGARSALFAAVTVADDSFAERQRLASLAKVKATDAFFYIASETIHLHGGIGFTFEHPAHLFFRRAKANQLLMGTRAEHQRSIFHSLLPIYQRERNTE